MRSLALGARHLLDGFDHLLFLACLVFIAGSTRRIVVTVSGFALAHSAALAAAALGWVRAPIPPVEAAIALSIVFVASEIARPARDTLTHRCPLAASASFGLLHGFGLASALREIGLPQTELPTALLFFNGGVELGQLAFLASLVALWQLARRTVPGLRALAPSAALARLRLPVGYAAGWVATALLIDRLAGFV